MPRSDKFFMGSQLYSPRLPLSEKISASTWTSPKKKHICNTCQRGFTTSGHLARHSRVHTGERNHQCPFPGCETRCSRQDNLQQHYRIHLSPGSRRNSVRINTARKRASVSTSSRSPPVELSRGYSRHSAPPESTPPLAQATLPGVSTLPYSRIDHMSGRVSAASSSGASSSYSPVTQHVLPTLSLPELPLPVSVPFSYTYRSGATSYHDQPSSNTYSTFVNNDTPVSALPQHVIGGTSGTHSQSHSNYYNHSHQQSRSASHCAVMPSRQSPSHIYTPRYASSHGPPSSTSVSSLTSSDSRPPTPVTYGDSHSYTHPHNAVISGQPAMHSGQMQSQSHLFQNSYTPNGVISHSPRYSPPPTLAPIQDERYIRRLETPRPSQSYNSHYPHHSLPGYPPYHHSISLGYGPWRETMRKGAGATAMI